MRTQVIQFLEDGILLQKPSACPDDVFHVMLGCWRREPSSRFQFDRIYRHLRELVDGNAEAVASAAADQAVAAAAGTTARAAILCGRSQPEAARMRAAADEQTDDSAHQLQQLQQQQHYSAIDFTIRAS